MTKESFHPHLILYNAKIYNPGSVGLPLQTALAVYGDRIQSVGLDSHILTLGDSTTKKINCHGHWLLPGLSDCHTHICEYASRKIKVDLSACRSLEEALKLIRGKVHSIPAGKWVTGGGWDKNLWGLADFPSKDSLDNITLKHFIALDSKDWHCLWVNTPVLQRCGIDDTAVDPAGGNIQRQPDSKEPKGILKENAREIVYKKIPPLPSDQLKKALADAFGEFHRYGITTAHTMESPDDYCIYHELNKEGNLGLRIFGYLPLSYLPNAENLQKNSAFQGHFLKICGIKIFADGTLGSQTADMIENFEDSSHAGIAVMPKDELIQSIGQCIDKRMPCAIHAIGDNANRKVLGAYEKYSAKSMSLKLRHRIEHAQLLQQADVARFACCNVTASMQPIHLASDIDLIKKFWGKRGEYAYAFGSLVKSGARVVFGSDTPVESFDPWKAIYTSIERKREVDPSNESFYPQQAVDLDSALTAYTQNAAWAVQEENHLGTITAGKFADMIVIDQDICNSPPEILLNTKVLMTIQGGKIIYQDLDF